VLGFQECNANCIAMVDDNDIQYMMKTLHIWLTPAYCRGGNLSQKKRPYKNVSRIPSKQAISKRIYRYKAMTKERTKACKNQV